MPSLKKAEPILLQYFQSLRVSPEAFPLLAAFENNHTLPQHDKNSTAASIVEAAVFICSTYWNWLTSFSACV